MRIGIDISQIVYETGVSVYTRGLVDALLGVDKKNKYVLFGGSLRRLDFLNQVVNNYHATPVPGGTGQAVYGSYVKGKILPLPPVLLDLIWNRLHILPVENFIGEVDVFHSSDWTQPPTSAYKVTTIHDLAPLRFPRITHPKIVDVHKRRLEWVKKEVDKIIAVSEFTKKEIIDLLGISEDRIVVIPEVADSRMKRQDEEEIREVKGKYGIEGKYLLVVGTDERKNIRSIVEAYKKVKRGLSELSLVVVGRGDVKDLEEVGGVMFIGHVSFDELAALYSGAEALVYTSLYEGFGLPILEAMQVGCPVVTSDLGAMKETAGSAAVLVDPNDIEDIKGGIEEAMGNRKSWVSRGLKRAREFSWEKASLATLEVYKQASD